MAASLPFDSNFEEESLDFNEFLVPGWDSESAELEMELNADSASDSPFVPSSVQGRDEAA